MRPSASANRAEVLRIVRISRNDRHALSAIVGLGDVVEPQLAA